MESRYSIEFEPAALRDLRRLPRSVQKQVEPVIARLAHDPRPAGVTKMQGRRDYYRVRSGDYRVIYRIEDDVLVVLIVTVGHRRDVYR